MLTSPWTWVALAFSIGAQFVVFLRWMHRRIRDDEIQRAFIRDLALRHLPAIYHALNMTAEQQGITLDETPMVNYVDLRQGRRRRKGWIRRWCARWWSRSPAGTRGRCAMSRCFSRS